MKKRVINTDKAPDAVGPYSQAIEAGKYIFTSGQIPINPETGELITYDIKLATIQALDNLKMVLQAAGTEMENVVKVSIFLADMDDFAAVNEIYATYFPDDSPARSCVEVSRLPKDAPLEIEAIAIK